MKGRRKYFKQNHMCLKNLLNALNVYVSRRMFGITFLKHAMEPLLSSNFTLYLGKSLDLSLFLEPTHLGKLLNAMQRQGSFSLLENSSLVERWTFVHILCNILASDPRTWYWTEFWSEVTWLNYVVVLSAVKRTETKLFFPEEFIIGDVGS